MSHHYIVSEAIFFIKFECKMSTQEDYKFLLHIQCVTLGVTSSIAMFKATI